MWKCKHCGEKFKFTSTSEKANHSRWCEKNPNRNNSNHLYAIGTTNKFGNKLKFIVNCFICSKQFEVIEREKLFPKKDVYFCSRPCANSVGGKTKAKKYHPDDTANYTTVAWRHHEKKCVVCGEERIVAVHHYNENHHDNRPENLVPVCPTHHQYLHSKYKNLIIDIVDNYVRTFVEKLGGEM